MKLAKKAIDEGMQTTLENGLNLEEKLYAQVLPSQDRIEGLKAFEQKRQPVYKGK